MIVIGGVLISISHLWSACVGGIFTSWTPFLSSVPYDECIKDCDKAVERGRELRANFKMIARALTRKGTAFVKTAKTSKDYEPAIEAF